MWNDIIQIYLEWLGPFRAIRSLVLYTRHNRTPMVTVRRTVREVPRRKEAEDRENLQNPSDTKDHAVAVFFFFRWRFFFFFFSPGSSLSHTDTPRTVSPPSWTVAVRFPPLLYTRTATFCNRKIIIIIIVLLLFGQRASHGDGGYICVPIRVYGPGGVFGHCKRYRYLFTV